MSDLERVLRGLHDAEEFARTFRFEITEDYRALIARVEAMADNQTGADKGGSSFGSRADRLSFFEGFTPAPRK